MKKIYSLYLLIACLVTTMSIRLNAQTYVEINYSYAYANNNCTVPATGYFHASVITLGYTLTDSIDVFVDFGDGDDTTFTLVQSFSNPFGYASTPSLSHIYTAQGIYPVTYIATLPDGNADTTNYAVMVTSTCNNVTGRVYVDVDGSCGYNTGDSPMQSYQVSLQYNGLTVASAYTIAGGLYTLDALPGYTYSLVTGSYNSPPLSYSCATSQGMTITPSPNASQDLISDNNTTVQIYYAGDSVAFNAGNCVPYSSNIYMSGNTLGYAAPNDSVHMYINFGDGTDTSLTVPATGPIGYFSFYTNHIYTVAGNYDVLYVATGTDGSNDSIINYNEISVHDTCGNVEGVVYVDNNNDCIIDAGDSLLPWILVELVDASTNAHYFAYTDANGHYSFSVSPATYTVLVNQNVIAYTGLVPTCPPSASVSGIVVTASSTTTQNFGMTCPSGFDLTGMISIQHGIFPTSTSYIRPYLNNLSCMPVPGSITFILDPLVNYVGVCDPAFTPIVTGNTLTWNFASSTNYYYWYYWYMQSGCIEIIGDPSLQIGDSVCFTMIISPTVGDMNPANNTIVRCVPAFVALDPNAKYVLPGGSGPQGFVPQGTDFDYTIQFQNTGTAPARDVFLLDSLDTDLDLSTLVITGSSHPMSTQMLPGNVLKFMFDDIWLADSTSDEANSHGWVTYHIAAKSFLPNMTQIQNTAGIYFDFNAPVITNSTLNTVYDPSSLGEVVSANGITIFPVPADEFIKITTTANTVSEIILTDISGRVIRTEQMTGTTTQLFTGDLADGVYMVAVKSEGNVITEKIVIQH
jgi:uncharacterized repeat protein (TIGR01451 family)